MKKYFLLALLITALVWIFIEWLPIKKDAEMGLSDNMLYGVMRSGGEMLIPLEYDYLSDVNDTLLAAGKEGKYGFIDLNNNIVIPFIYDNMKVFRGEKVAVCKDDKWGLIDPLGKEIIPNEYEDIRFLAPEYNTMLARKKGLYGIVNYITGENMTSFIYKTPVDGVGSVLILEYKGKTGAINWQGEVILPFEYKSLDLYFSRECIVVNKKKLYGVADLDGNILIPIEYDEIKVGEDNMFSLNKKGLWGLSDMNHSMKTLFSYKYMGYFACGVVSVSEDDIDYGAIDEYGNLAVASVYTHIGSFKNGYASATYNHIYSGVVSKSGREIFPFGDFSFDIVSNRENLATVYADNYYALIDLEGNFYTDFEYDYILADAFEGYLSVEKDKKYGAIDTVGNLIIPCVSDMFVHKFGEDCFYIRVKKE